MNIEKIKEQDFLDIEDPGKNEIIPIGEPRTSDKELVDTESCLNTSNNIEFGQRCGSPTGGLSEGRHTGGLILDPLLRRRSGGDLGDASTKGGDLGEAAFDPLHGRADTQTEGGGTEDQNNSLNEPLHPTVEDEHITGVKKERIDIENECKKMKNIKTLVLEGCGTSGFYILGYIQKAIDIYKLDLNSIKNYIASSSGTITSFLLSIGYTPMEILIYVVKDSGINSSFEKIKKINIANMLLGKGIISFEIIKKIITDMTLEKIGYIPTFSDIKKTKNINLVFSVYNITKQITEYMSYKKYPELSCIDCIEMSCAIPVIFPEIVYNRQRYIDGAVGNCFPVEMLSILKGQESASDKPAAERSTSETDELSDYAGTDPNRSLSCEPKSIRSTGCPILGPRPLDNGIKSSHTSGGENDGEFKKNTLAISLTNRHIKEEICYIYENPLKYLLSLFLIYVNEIKKNKKINKDNNIIFVDLDVSNSSITNTVLESNIQILDMFSYGYKQCRK